jgi:hypothetical protein
MASGDTLLAVPAAGFEYPSSNYATPDARNDHRVADFDASSDESILINGFLPEAYDGGGITLTLVWAASGVSSGNVVWDAQFERHEDDATDLDSDSFASVQSVTDACANVDGEPVYSDITFTNAQIDGLLKNESFRLKVTRDANNASDTMAADAELLRVIVKET